MATVEHDPTAASPTGSRDAIAVHNPATGEVVRTVPATPPAEVERIVARARAAQTGWEALGFDGRARILRRAQKWVVDNSERIIDTIVAETGKTREDAQLAEVSYAAHSFGFWAKKAPDYLADEKVHSSNLFVFGRKLVVRYRPVGVVGIIGPWNYPLTNSFGDAIPALAAGNAVVLKPSEVTPLTSLLMEECMRACGLPEDVYVALPGYGDVGAEMIKHVDMVMFTGSTRTGKKIMAEAAERLIPVSLELGGKDPMIVLSDADVERAANAAVHYSMQNAGQTCISVERVYVEEPIYDTFVAKVTDKVRGLRQGVPGAAGSTDVGAITFPPQVDVIERARLRRHGQGRARRRRRPRPPRARAVLRADGARRRRPLDALHARGDVRADAADHAGARRRRGGRAGQRLPLRARRLGLGRRRRRAPSRWRAGSRRAS